MIIRHMSKSLSEKIERGENEISGISEIVYQNEEIREAQAELLKLRLIRTGKVEGVFYNREDLIEKYGAEILNTKAKNKFQAEQALELFLKYVTDIWGIFEGTKDDVKWDKKLNYGHLKKPVNFACETKVTGYLGHKDRLIVILENHWESAKIFLEVPNID